MSTINARPNRVSYRPCICPSRRSHPSTNIMMGIVGSSRRETSPPSVSLMLMLANPCCVSAARTARLRMKNATAVCTAIEVYGRTSYRALTP